MKWYRVYLYSASGSLQGRDEYEAEDDRAAMTVAEHLCDACSDVCQSFELWDGVRRVDSSFSRMPHPSVTFEKVSVAAQHSVIRCAEALRDSEWAVARSKRLTERIERLSAGRR